MNDSCSARKLEPGLAAMYSKPSDEDVDHEIGPGVLDRDFVAIDFRRHGTGLRCQLAGGRGGRRSSRRHGAGLWCGLRGFHLKDWNRPDHRGCSRGCTGSGAFQKAAAIDAFPGFH